MIWLLFVPISTVLGSLGGQKGLKWARVILLPILVGLALAIKHIHSPWWPVYILLSILTVATCNIIRIGYGAYDPVNDDKPSFLGKITKDTDGWVVRTVWGAMTAVVACLPYLVFNVIIHDVWALIKIAAFSILFALTCFATVRLRSNIFWTDGLVWAVFGLIVATL